MILKHSLSALAAVLALGIFAGEAQAQARVEGRSALVQKLADCRKLTDNAARLACYDQTAEALDQAEAKGDIVVVDREQARKVRRQAFGFSLPSISLFEKGETQEALENVADTVVAARQNSMGQWVVELKDGGTWAQIDANELFKTPRAGMTAKIRKASMGSFLMTIDNQRAFRARRVE